MATGKCSISFMVDYTSSNPIKSATFTYEHTVTHEKKNYHMDPAPSSGDPITLYPEILTPGDYILTVELETTDGSVVATQTSSFEIGNCSGNNQPTVLLRWDDNSATEDRICDSSACSFTIEDYATDPDNDIVLNQIFKSIDNGATWDIFIANVTQSTFTDSIDTFGTQLYKAVVVDSNNNTATSNILSYTKQPDIGKFYHKVMNGISCVGNGDGPTNYDVWCTGQENFSLSDSNLSNISVGFMRLKIDGGTPEIGLSKSGGGALVIDEVLPITSVFTTSYAATGQNPPSAYPWGYPANVNSAVYRFEFSVNGTAGWTVFDLSVDD